jgi:hypothetical protein
MSLEQHTANQVPEGLALVLREQELRAQSQRLWKP